MIFEAIVFGLVLSGLMFGSGYLRGYNEVKVEKIQPSPTPEVKK